MIKTFKLKELSEKYDIHIQTIYNWKKKGKIIPIKFNYRSNSHVRYLDLETSFIFNKYIKGKN